METTIVKIGNSKGLIIPKKLLNAFGEATQVDIKAKDGGLIITPLAENKSRSNWQLLLDLFSAKGVIINPPSFALISTCVASPKAFRSFLGIISPFELPIFTIVVSILKYLYAKIIICLLYTS